MGRPRTGSVQPRGKRWLASVVATPGSNRRVHRTFATEEEADAWVAAALAALARGAAPARAPRGRARARRVPPGRMRFVDACDAWHRRTYLESRIAGPKRADDVRSVLDRYVLPFFAARVDYVDEITVDDVEDFASWMAGRHLTAVPGSAETAPAMPGQEVGLKEAAALTGRSKSTIWRAHRAGQFPNERWDTSAGSPRLHIPVADLAAAGLTIAASGSARPPGGLRQVTARQYLGVLRAVVRWAQARGLIATDPTVGVRALDPDPAVAVTPPDTATPRVLYFHECATVAAFLDVHHQVCYWLGRVCGLRLGEVFGVHVSDVDPNGFLRVRVQGGAAMLRWGSDGRRVRLYEADLKSKAGVRLVPIPPSLLALVMLYIQAWHADPVTGEIDESARLVRPRRPGSGTGQSTYTNALTNALIYAKLDRRSIGFTNLTHHLRKSFGGDLSHYGRARAATVSRLIGHRIPADGGSPVTVTHYAPPNVDDLEPFVVAMDTIEGLIVDAMPDGLLRGTDPMVIAGPDMGMPEQQAHARRVIADALAARTPTETYTVGIAADLLELSPKQVRRLIESGGLESAVSTSATGRPVASVTRRSVEAYASEQRDSCTLKEAAELTGIDYATLYARVRRGTLPFHRGPDGRTPRIRWSEVKVLREEVELRAALDERSLTVPAAAKAIRRHTSTVERLLAVGKLEADPSADWTGLTYVTRASLAQYQEAQGKDPATVWASQVRSAVAPLRTGGALQADG